MRQLNAIFSVNCYQLINFTLAFAKLYAEQGARYKRLNTTLDEKNTNGRFDLSISEDQTGSR